MYVKNRNNESSAIKDWCCTFDCDRCRAAQHPIVEEVGGDIVGKGKGSRSWSADEWVMSRVVAPTRHFVTYDLCKRRDEGWLSPRLNEMPSVGPPKSQVFKTG